MMTGAAMRARAVAIYSLVLLLVAAPVYASSIHLKGGRNAEPTFRDLGLTLQSTGQLAGLGNEDVLITLTAVGDPTAVCINPSGKNEPPGQNPAPVELTGTQSIPAEEIKNGNVAFNVVTEAPESPIPGAPDCPNPRWTEEITDVSFSSATITVEQGDEVFIVDCFFDQETTDGSVSRDDVTCSSS